MKYKFLFFGCAKGLLLIDRRIYLIDYRFSNVLIKIGVATVFFGVSVINVRKLERNV